MLVVWSDCEVGIITERTLERIRSIDALCSVPTIRSERGTVVPSVTAPAFYGTRFRTIPAQPGNQSETLYPFDYSGVYGRDRFLRSGGFDRSIVNPYWQLLDFGFRAYLWGERIAVVPGEIALGPGVVTGAEDAEEATAAPEHQQAHGDQANSSANLHRSSH